MVTNPLHTLIMAITRSNEILLFDREQRTSQYLGRLPTSPRHSKGFQCGFITDAVAYSIETRGFFRQYYVLNIMDFRLTGRAFEQTVKNIHLCMVGKWWSFIATYASIDWSIWDPTSRCIIIGNKTGIRTIEMEKV